jgi:hypothetical protein
VHQQHITVSHHQSKLRWQLLSLSDYGRHKFDNVLDCQSLVTIGGSEVARAENSIEIDSVPKN